MKLLKYGVRDCVPDNSIADRYSCVRLGLRTVLQHSEPILRQAEVIDVLYSSIVAKTAAHTAVAEVRLKYSSRTCIT